MDVTADMSVASLAEKLNLPENGVAIALNGKLVPRGEWDRTALNDKDSLLIVNAAYGG